MQVLAVTGLTGLHAYGVTIQDNDDTIHALACSAEEDSTTGPGLPPMLARKQFQRHFFSTRPGTRPTTEWGVVKYMNSKARW